jgi:hypothetical protein
LAEPGGVFEKMLGLKALYMVGVTQTEWSNMRGYVRKSTSSTLNYLLPHFCSFMPHY